MWVMAEVYLLYLVSTGIIYNKERMSCLPENNGGWLGKHVSNSTRKVHEEEKIG